MSTVADTDSVVLLAWLAPTRPCPVLAVPILPGSVLPRARKWVVPSFLKPTHFGFCSVQSPSLLQPVCRAGLPPDQLPKASSAPGSFCTCLLSSRREAPAAGDTCPWALAKPHKWAGQGSTLPSNLAEWTGGWHGGVGTAWGLGDSDPPHSWSPFLSPLGSLVGLVGW